MVAFRVELTQQQKRNRGQLIPCMNQALGKFEVCCKKPPTPEILVETVESLPAGLPVIDPAQSAQQSSKQTLPSSLPSSSPSSSPSSCPALGPLPPISACAGRQSNCWSVGVRDLDCLDSALCCFDGCANVCLGRGPIAGNPGPQSNPRLPTTIQEIIAPPTRTQDASATNNLLPVVQQQDMQQSDFVFPEPEQENSETFGLPSPTQQFVEYDEVQNKKDTNTDTSLAKQTLDDVFPNQGFESNAPQNISPGQLSTTSTPYVQCPSAMKCVPRVNCDFNGVMVNFNVILSQVQEEQRVPLIPCFNPARGNSVDVCCRDPNYKDPWPDMDRSGANQASAPAPASQFQVIDNSPTQALEQHLAAQKNNQQKQTQNNKNRRPGYGK